MKVFLVVCLAALASMAACEDNPKCLMRGEDGFPSKCADTELRHFACCEDPKRSPRFHLQLPGEHPTSPGSQHCECQLKPQFVDCEDTPDPTRCNWVKRRTAELASRGYPTGPYGLDRDGYGPRTAGSYSLDRDGYGPRTAASYGLNRNGYDPRTAGSYGLNRDGHLHSSYHDRDVMGSGAYPSYRYRHGPGADPRARDLPTLPPRARDPPVHLTTPDISALRERMDAMNAWMEEARKVSPNERPEWMREHPRPTLPPLQ